MKRRVISGAGCLRYCVHPSGSPGDWLFLLLFDSWAPSACSRHGCRSWSCLCLYVRAIRVGIESGLKLQIDHLRLGIFQHAILSVCTTDSGFAPSGMIALHGFEVLAVHVSLPELELPTGAHGCVDIRRSDRQS